VILLFGISGWLSGPQVGNDWRWKSALWLLLLVCIALNIGGYPKQRQIMIDSSYFQRQWKHSQFFAARYALSEGSQNASMQPAEPDSWQMDFSEAELNFLDDVRAKYAALKQPGR
jgi:hypothetical protein